MTRGGRPCTAWTGTGPCGTAPARLYPAGWRCDEHTPARSAGRAEPPAIPPPTSTSSTERSTPMLTAALEASDRGWRVFPLRPGTKRPARPGHDAKACDRTDPRCRGGHTGWEPRATTDPGRIRRGWAAAPFNIGIACGPSRLVVVDLDTPKPGDTPPLEWAGARTGADVLAKLCERAGEPYPAATWTVVTPSGGVDRKSVV